MDRKSRRGFLKTVGAGALAAVSGCSVDSNRKGSGVKEAASRIQTKARDVWQTDVLVVGGGMAGMGAALAASRAGAKTILIEDNGFMGGVASYALGMPINQMRPDSKPRGDIHELIIAKIKSYGDIAYREGQHQYWCNVDYLKVALINALEETGCKYFVHVNAVDTIVKGNRVEGVLAGTKSGPVEIRAKCVIDCTGDADVSYFSGAETLKEAGQLSPLTLLLKVTNVDMEEAKRVNIGELAKKAREKYPLVPKDWRLTDNDPSSNSFYINHSCLRDLGQFDGSDPESLTKAEVTARRQAIQMVGAMREFGGDALSKMELIGTSPRIAVRESRRVKGVYVLTEEDAVEGHKFDDVIAWRSGFLDIGFVRLREMKIHDVPYRSILPEKVDGLLTAGRCISATHAAASAGKSMGNCVATGHAAGLAAAMAVKGRIVPRELKISKLQDALRADNVDLTKGGSIQENVTLLG